LGGRLVVRFGCAALDGPVTGWQWALVVYVAGSVSLLAVLILGRDRWGTPDDDELDEEGRWRR
jgi:hypothetical protein